MAVYDKNGNALLNVYDKNGMLLPAVYDKNGNVISGAPSPYISGVPYSFDAMQYTDEDNVSEETVLHTRNGSKTIKYTPTIGGNVATTDAEREWVTFACNISTNNKPVGLWIYTPVDALPCYGGKSKYKEGLQRLKVKLNGTTTYECTNIRPGMSYYKIMSPPATITSISVSAVHMIDSTIRTASLYLDSLEVGFSARRAHVMFNLDCVPSNFIAVGYPLFEEFGLKCTLQYHISDTDSSMGADSSYLNTAIHSELVAKGYDYATYSGWKNYETASIGAVPFYDDDARQAAFEDHAERMWKVNNNSGIYAPSCIHGTGFLWGHVYNTACRDYPFLMIRRGNNQGTEGQQTFYDSENRVMEPYFLENAWSASDVSTLKSRIDYAISSKQALQIGFHQIMPADYDNTQSGSGIYVGVNAIRELLSYVKAKVTAGDIICCTTAEYVAEMEPTVYADWLAYRQHQVN